MLLRSIKANDIKPETWYQALGTFSLMYKTEAYYFLKLFLPRRMQLAIRRQIVRWKLARYRHIWPIDRNAAQPPKGWNGWPDGKKFALVLTHDVESLKGVRKCRQLMELDKSLGFKSSFNFVATDYTVPEELRADIHNNGFEIGMHGLRHDRNPFRSQKVFEKQAVEINRYMKEWGISGFRSPSMYHNLDMLHLLDIAYDASTFDTDPFEPQPDGMGTIFPFWVSSDTDDKGYVELPYTLPQDFLLLCLMKEKTIDIWKKKLDWIVENGGMALLITHPDYMTFDGVKIRCSEYPADLYKELLVYIREKYDGRYWNALPREVADYWKNNFRRNSSLQFDSIKEGNHMSENKKKRVWIDLDNSPHVPFFKPIINELTNRGYDLTITARDCFQVCGLADLMHVKYEKIGKHYGKHILLKVAGLLIRSSQLAPTIRRAKPDLAISHGSRSQVLLSSLLNIPSIVIADYEFVQIVARPTYILAPELIPDNAVKGYKRRLLKYPGIKEDVYVPFFEPDPALMDQLGINNGEIIITIRPPATEAHYHNPESEILFKAIVDYIGQVPDTRMVMLPRNEVKQTAWIKDTWTGWCNERKIIIPDHVVDGLNLIYYSDLVVSGGGTMNREAAAMGVPVYSIFRGKIGAVDHYLSENGRLTLLESVDDIQQKLNISRRDKSSSIDKSNKTTLNKIVDTIEEVLNEKR